MEPNTRKLYRYDAIRSWPVSDGWLDGWSICPDDPNFGVRISAKAYIHPSVLLGSGAVVESGAAVEFGVVVGTWATVGSNATIKSGTVIGSKARIGAGSVVEAGEVVGVGEEVRQ